MTTAKKPAANSKGATKRVVGRPFPKGVSGNPAGRPKTGESWSEIFRQVGEMYPEDVVAIVGANNDLGKAYSHFPKNVQMKIQVAIRVVAALMFEPTQGLLKETLDRIEGKVPERLQMEGTLGIDGLRQMIAKVYGTTSDDSSK